MLRYIKGYLKIRVIGYSPERFLNACSHRGIYIWGITPVHGSYDMYVSVSGFRKLKPIIRKTGAKVVITERIGLPFYLFHYRRRRMFFAGAVFGIALIYFLSLFVWSIDVRGNRKYTDEALLTFLAEQGVTHGMRLSQVDCDRIVKDIRKSYDEIIWVSASIEGCRLIVQIKENEDSKDIVSTQKEALEGIEEGRDIVADQDGVITKIIVRKGLPCVAEGEQVTKGQILVTGAVPVVNDAGETIGYHFQKAEADIRAQIIIDYKNGCDLEYAKKQYLSPKKEELYLRLGKHLFWLGNPKNQFEYSDELTTVSQLRIGNYFYLPVFWGSRVTTPYILEETKYNKEAIQKSLSEEYHRFADSLEKKGVEIIQNDVKIYTGPLQAQAKGTLTVITDIGTEQPVSIAEDVADGDD
ncbi:MAG: sporulation protein YqfD [Eubacteriales bacterium]|nr:sporulation protein YqfD [Eubacteriales bacterium]